jgi:hypothetical protein
MAGMPPPIGIIPGMAPIGIGMGTIIGIIAGMAPG